jgi:PAS domain S-box-containing protein
MVTPPPADSPDPKEGGANTRGFAELNDAIERFKILNDLTLSLSAARDLTTKLQLVTDKGWELLGVDVCFIALRPPKGGGYHVQVVSGSEMDILTGWDLPEEVPPFREVRDPLAACETARREEAYTIPWLQGAPVSISSGIGIPLQVGDRRYGILFAGDKTPRDFSVTDWCILSLSGNFIAAEIHREKSEETQLRLETVLEQAVESIMITDASGIIQYVNPAFETITGYSREEALGRTPHFLKSGHHSVGFYRDLWETLVQGKVWRGHFTNRKKSGELYELEASISPVRNAAGVLTHFVSVRNDVTQTRQLEKQLRHAQKMEAIGTLAGGIAHDFNNLLMGIQGNVSLLLSGMEPETRSYQQCKAIEDAIERGADLTRQLLGLGRGGTYRTKPTDLNVFIRETLQVFGRTLKEIQIHTDLMASPCVAIIDPNQMSQVLLNLLVNAWQAMPAGGDLFVSTQTARLDEEASRPLRVAAGDFAEITVKDTGEGIEEAIQNRIFDPFFTTKKKFCGTGLGLASSYGIIKNHGGMITVSSQRHQGSTFRIYLPLSSQPPTTAAFVPPDAQAGSETVLLVDDEQPVLDITKQMLEHLGYRVVAVNGGRMAIEAFEKHPIDIVILDMIMPEMGGGKTLEELLKRDPKVKVLLSSGYTTEFEAANVLTRGCVGFIQKPFSMEQISRKLREALGGARP